MATEPAAGVWVGLGDEDEGVGGGVDDAAETVIKTTDVLGCGDGSLAQPVPAPRRTTQNAPQMMDQRLALRRVSIKLDHWAVESGSVRGVHHDELHLVPRSGRSMLLWPIPRLMFK